jgi:hypothetical protein
MSFRTSKPLRPYESLSEQGDGRTIDLWLAWPSE